MISPKKQNRMKKPKLKSSSLRRTVILDRRTRELVGAMVKKNYNALPVHDITDRAEIIRALLNMGMTREADELIHKT